MGADAVKFKVGDRVVDNTGRKMTVRSLASDGCVETDYMINGAYQHYSEFWLTHAPAEPAKITMDGKYQTRNGRAVRIYAVDGTRPRPVHGAIRTTEGNWYVRKWRADGIHGEHGCPSPNDLIPAPTKKYRVVIEPFATHTEANEALLRYRTSGRVEEYEA